MTYTIVGTGNIACFFAKRLTAAGHQCEGIYGRDAAAAGELASDINSKTFERITDIYDGLADVCFLCVTDHIIDRMAKQLSFHNTVMAHTAGSVNLDVLAGAAKDHAVLWPVYSIQKNNLPNHRNIPFAWDGATDKARRYIQSIAHGITDILFEANDGQRRWLHLSAVISNNFTNHLMAICEQVCTNNNVPFAMLHPIIQQTFEQVKKESPLNTQTGPAKRGDTFTVEKQTELLHSEPFWQRVYESLSNSIAHTYKSKKKE